MELRSHLSKSFMSVDVNISGETIYRKNFTFHYDCVTLISCCVDVIDFLL